MFEALVQDRVDFVQLFIDSGVNFKKFLSVRRCRDLYDKVSGNIYLWNAWLWVCFVGVFCM